MLKLAIGNSLILQLLVKCNRNKCDPFSWNHKWFVMTNAMDLTSIDLPAYSQFSYSMNASYPCIRRRIVLKLPCFLSFHTWPYQFYIYTLQLRKSKSKKKVSEEEGDETSALWLAVRCAGAVANAQRSRLLLIGDAGVTSQTLSDRAQAEMPDFVALDLVGGYVLGEKKKVFKSK